MIRFWRRLTPFFMLIVGFVASANAEIAIKLQNGWIEECKNRATFDVSYLVDKAHKKPKRPSEDGDIHVAGRADEVGLPVVAEMMNAKDDLKGVKTFADAEGTGNPIAVTGFWRLWCEHGGNDEQIQGEPLQPFTTTNPDHVFEIHPVTAIEQRSVLSTLKPIKGYKTKDAEQAFTKYEGIR